MSVSNENSNQEVQQKIRTLRSSLKEIAESCGRDAAEVDFILVSKTVCCDRVREAYDAGIRSFGENRVQELLEKRPQFPDDVKWHMIGHLQTNKVKQILGKVSLIESLDRLELAKEIEKQATRLQLSEVPCLIQVDCSGEASKFGFPFEKVKDFVREISKDSPIKICGIMTIGPNTEDQDVIRAAFRKTRMLRDELMEEFPELDWRILSMGMTNDYKIAIEEGSTLVRIGSAVFGPRNY